MVVLFTCLVACHSWYFYFLWRCKKIPSHSKYWSIYTVSSLFFFLPKKNVCWFFFELLFSNAVFLYCSRFEIKMSYIYTKYNCCTLYYINSNTYHMPFASLAHLEWLSPPSSPPPPPPFWAEPYLAKASGDPTRTPPASPPQAVRRTGAHSRTGGPTWYGHSTIDVRVVWE